MERIRFGEEKKVQEKVKTRSVFFECVLAKLISDELNGFGSIIKQNNVI